MNFIIMNLVITSIPINYDCAMTEIAPKIRRLLRSAVCMPLNSLINRVDPPVLVLLYHRVTTLSSDPEMLAVTPDNFRAQIRFLKENFPIVRFEEDWANVRKPAIAITFDDGYADNALEALPILEEAGAPATFFVSTGTIGTSREFWWHELERIILETQSLPATFSLDDISSGKTWPTGTGRHRQEFYHEIVRLMTDTDILRRDDWLGQLRTWAESKENPADINRAMSIGELKLLAASRWVTIGAHTVSHCRLSSLPPEAQRDEITASKRQLENWLERDITTFSYPFGRRSDYTRQSAALCQEAGFSRVAANFPGQAHRWTDPYQIPRHLIRNWPVEVFAEKLREFWTR
jgi:peptidoglycan/xylan/chitin deacetylase (PgdA/CDA1 family)